MEMSGILSLQCFSKGKTLELRFKIRVVWSERGLGLGLGMGVTVGHLCWLLSREQRNNPGDGYIPHPQKARVFTGGPAVLPWAHENSVVKPL